MGYVSQLLPNPGSVFFVDRDGDVDLERLQLGRRCSSAQLALYDPQTDAWTFPSATGAEPERRASTTAVWTGDAVLVWGGVDVGALGLASGGRYQVSSATWSSISTTGAPSARYGHLAVWTGTRMLVWGGGYGSEPAKSGGSYDPVTDSWSPISSTNGPPASAPTGTWTGTGSSSGATPDPRCTIREPTPGVA